MTKKEALAILRSNLPNTGNVEDDVLLHMFDTMEYMEDIIEPTHLCTLMEKLRKKLPKTAKGSALMTDCFNWESHQDVDVMDCVEVGIDTFCAALSTYLKKHAGGKDAVLALDDDGELLLLKKKKLSLAQLRTLARAVKKNARR